MARWSDIATAGGRLTVLLLGLILPAPASVTGQQASEVITGGSGTFFTGSYAARIHVVDEETLALVDTIMTQNGIPGRLIVSENRERIYVTDATYEYVEVIDVATRESIDSFTLNDGARRFRMRGGFSVDPQENYALIVGSSRIKRADRYEIHANVIIRYDLKKHEVIDTIPWPDGHARSRVNFMFSPDGSLAYFSAEDMIVLETESFTEVDRWAISEESEPGLGIVRPSFDFSYFEEPGFFTGLVRVTDPINNRRLMGIARVNLAEREMNFRALGPDQPLRRFALAPGAKKAWALYNEVGNYEFWAFDLEEGRVTHRQPFPGRPRMGLTVSSNGKYLYIHVAGNTIDVYDSETYEHLKTVDVGGDMRGFVFLPRADGQ